MKFKNVKVGMKVEVKSLKHTKKRFGVNDCMCSVGEQSFIHSVSNIGLNVSLGDTFTYDVRDLKKVKEK